MIEAKSASSSANEVSISTWVAGRCARMSRVASMPLPSERRTSMTITAGSAPSASPTPSPAEPGAVEQRPDAVADDLVVVDQHDPQRWPLHSHILPARADDLKHAARRRTPG